jgi:hypothetical protein
MRCPQARLAVAILLTTMNVYGAEDTFEPLGEVVAINVLLELDGKILDVAQRDNQRLRATNRESFAFDATHVPHISLLHRFVRQRDLPAVYAAAERAVAEKHVTALTLTATGLEITPWEDAMIVSITVQKTPELDRVQDALVRALAPFSVEQADEYAFARTMTSMHVDSTTLDYVATFVPQRVGKDFKPHITVGLTDSQTAQRMQSEAFAQISFHPSGVAIYQLGNLGTARRRLHQLAKD